MWEIGRAIRILFSWQSMNLLQIFEVYNPIVPKKYLNYPQTSKSVSLMVILPPTIVIIFPNVVTIFFNMKE